MSLLTTGLLMNLVLGLASSRTIYVYTSLHAVPNITQTAAIKLVFLTNSVVILEIES